MLYLTINSLVKIFVSPAIPFTFALSASFSAILLSILVPPLRYESPPSIIKLSKSTEVLMKLVNIFG